MRKLVSLASTILVTAALVSTQIVVRAEDTRMTFSPDPPQPGEQVTANYDADGTPDVYGWYVVSPSMVKEENGEFVWNNFDWATTATTSTGEWTLPAGSEGKFLYCRAINADWSVCYQESFITRIDGVPPLYFEEAVIEAGGEIHAVASNMGETAYRWYLFGADMVDTDAAGKAALKEGLTDAQLAAARQEETSDTLALSANAKGKFLYCETIDGEGAVIQRAELTKVFGPLGIGAQPQKKKVIFGFENIADDVRIGDKDSDHGPTALRRPSTGELWNPGASTWGNTMWLGFPDNYALTAIDSEDAPQGGRVGKWTNLVGETYPEGTDVWAYTNINLALEEPRNTYLKGATEFTFWIDASHYETGGDPLVFQPRFSSTGYDGQGKYTGKYGEYCPSAGSAAYYWEDGQWVGARVLPENGFYAIPSGYTGYVRMPLEDYVGVSWNPADAHPEFSLYNVNNMIFYFYTYAGEGTEGSYALLDDFAFAGDAMEEMPATFYEEAIHPEEGYLASAGLENETGALVKATATGAALRWDAIGSYSASYAIHLYQMADEYDETGDYVKTYEAIPGAAYELTGLKPSTLYGAQIVAYNKDGLRIGIYDLVLFKTAEEEKTLPPQDPGKTGNGTGTTAPAEEPAGAKTGDAAPVAAFAAFGLSGLLLWMSRTRRARR